MCVAVGTSGHPSHSAFRSSSAKGSGSSETLQLLGGRSSCIRYSMCNVPTIGSNVEGDRTDACCFPLEESSNVGPGCDCRCSKLRCGERAFRPCTGHAEHRGALSPLQPLGSDGVDQLQASDCEGSQGEGRS